MVGVIGIITGSIAFLIDVGIYYLRQLKFYQFQRGKLYLTTVYNNSLLVYELTQHSGTVFLALLVLIGFNGLYSIVAAILVAIEVIYTTV